MNNFQLKCVQLDLARQKENIPYIKEFITFAAAAGYDSIMLYLEDRIKTASYPYIPDAESYSVQEMREIVAFASEKNIELIPCVATLGHAELFLQRPELAHLSEVQDGMKDRFGNAGFKNVFCITHEEFYPFMEKYIAEVAEIFPSDYFHAGLDEFFNFNLCERCRKLMPTKADEEKMFLKHIIRINDCLKKLNKRMMMWSDMFEIYTTVMPDVPKNIIMVDWQYQEDVRFYLGHLFELGVENRQKINDELGFTAVIAPADRDAANVESALKYGCEKNVWGYLVTSWEKSDTFLYRSYPTLFYAGQRLAGKTPEEAWKNSIRYIFNSNDEMLFNTVKLISCDSNICHFGEVGEGTFCIRPFSGLHLNKSYQVETFLSMLQACKNKINSEFGLKVYEDLYNMLEEKCIANEFKSSFWDVIDYGTNPEFFERAEKNSLRFEKLLDKKSDDWKNFRAGIINNIFAKKREQLINSVRNKIDNLKRGSYIKFRFCMTDVYVVNHFSSELLINGKWHQAVIRNGAKPSRTDALYEHVCFCDISGVPEAIKITVSGMGGKGVAYAEVRTSDGKIYVPSAVIETQNIVEHADYILENDGKFAWFNTQSTRYNYDNIATSEIQHSVTLELKEI